MWDLLVYRDSLVYIDSEKRTKLPIKDVVANDDERESIADPEVVELALALRSAP